MKESNNWISLQRYKTQSHRSETLFLPLFLSKTNLKSCKLNQFLHCHSNQATRRLYPQNDSIYLPPQPHWAPFVFLRLPEVQTHLTLRLPCASASIAHLTHVGLTPQLGPTEQHRRQCSGVAVSLVLAFLLKRAAGWHHASRQPMRCIHLSERLQTSESVKSHLVEKSGTAWQVSAQLPSRKPRKFAALQRIHPKKMLHPTTEIRAHPCSWLLWSQ